MSFSDSHEPNMDASRRRFLGAQAPGPVPIRPPWSLPEDEFLSRCSRCDDCLQACPTGVLVRGQGSYPQIEFSVATCTFCGDCARACTTGAIQRDVTQKPWSLEILIGDQCLAAQRVECRVCGEICDFDAIRFRPRIGGAPLPTVDASQCTGCVACVAPCPARAISVRQRAAVSALEQA